MKITIFTDGGARGNPGPAGIGALLLDDKGNALSEISEYIGETTNNQAEYQAVIAGMKKAVELGCDEAEFFMDSELVVKQLNREYKVKNADLAPLFLKIHNLSQSFKNVSFCHIRREQNTVADKLANLAMDSVEKS